MGAGTHVCVLLPQHSAGCFFGWLLLRGSQCGKKKKQAGIFPRDQSKAPGIRDLRPGSPCRAWEAPNPGVHRPELTTTVNAAQRKAARPAQEHRAEDKRTEEKNPHLELRSLHPSPSPGSGGRTGSAVTYPVTQLGMAQVQSPSGRGLHDRPQFSKFNPKPSRCSQTPPRLCCKALPDSHSLPAVVLGHPVMPCSHADTLPADSATPTERMWAEHQGLWAG